MLHQLPSPATPHAPSLLSPSLSSTHSTRPVSRHTHTRTHSKKSNKVRAPGAFDMLYFGELIPKWSQVGVKHEYKHAYTSVKQDYSRYQIGVK